MIEFNNLLLFAPVLDWTDRDPVLNSANSIANTTSEHRPSLLDKPTLELRYQEVVLMDIYDTIDVLRSLKSEEC